MSKHQSRLWTSAQLERHAGSRVIATTLQPTNDLESAIVMTLQPGNYTAQLRGSNNGTGNGSVEVYDLP